MDLTSLLFLALMVAVTGLMAFAGDSLGRYLGKKRVKLGGLRPKHTAGLLTAGAGSLGALLVVLVLMGISEPVRVWILTGNKARSELLQSQADLDRVKKEKEAVNQELQASRQRLTKEELKAKESEGRNQTLTAQNRSLLGSSERVQAEIRNKTAEATKLRQDVAKERALLGDVRKQYESEKAGAARIRFDNTEIQKRNLELTRANTLLEKQKQDLEGSSAALEAQTTDLRASIDALQKTFDSTSLQQRALLTASQSQLSQSVEELARTNDLLLQVRSDLAALERERLALLGLSEASRQQPMVAERHDELSRIPIPANSTLAEAKSLLEVGIERAGKSAINRGSGVSPITKSAVIFIDFRRPGQATLTAELQKQAIWQEMAGKPDDRVLILRALVNSFGGEPVPLDAAIFRNTVIYSSGQVVAETRLDGRKPQEEIAEDLETFVRGPMASAVMRAGIIPAKGTAQPLGELSRDMVLRIVQAVKASGVSVKVQFLAATETRAGDGLKLNYRLR
jgi:hypothetical protein